MSLFSIRKGMELRATAVALLVVAGCAGAQAQSAGFRASGLGGLRGSGSDDVNGLNSVADQFRSAPAAGSSPSGTVTGVDDPSTGPAPNDPAQTPSSETSGAASGSASGGASAGTGAYERPPPPPGIARQVRPVKRYGPQRPVIRTPLPPLRPYDTAVRPRGEVKRETRDQLITLRGTDVTADPARDLPVVNPPGIPAPTISSLPRYEKRRRLLVEQTPYAPVGIGIGSLRLFPFAEVDGGYDDNPDQTVRAAAKPSAFVRTEVGASLQSDWSRHSLSGELRGSYYDYFSNPNANRPEAAGLVNSRIDITRDFTLDSAARFAVSTQRPGSPEIALGRVVNANSARPLVYTYGGETGVTKRFNRFAVTLRASADHYAFEDAKGSNGTVVPLSGNDYTAFVGKARLSYELSPGVTPFVEGLGSVRRYDNNGLDSSGFLRNSVGQGVRVGSTFEVSRLLTGEASVGYERRDYVDRRLRPLEAPLLDAALIYKPTALTTVTLRTASSIDETNVPLSAGATSRRVSLEVSHALLRNLTLTGLLAYQNINYSGVKLTEDLYDVGLKAEYALSRSVVVRGSFTNERLKSNSTGLDYTQNVFLLGLRLQR